MRQSSRGLLAVVSLIRRRDFTILVASIVRLAIIGNVNTRPRKGELVFRDPSCSEFGNCALLGNVTRKEGDDREIGC